MPETRLIAISGKQYAGKDLLTSLLLVKLPQFRQAPIALAIKTRYAEQHGLTLADIEAHKAEHRPGLIALGDWGRAQDPDYWLKQMLQTPGPKIVSDLRLKREADLLRLQGAFLIRLNADRAVRASRGPIVSETDATETELDNALDWDCVFTNNGSVAALQAQVDDCPLFRAPAGTA